MAASAPQQPLITLYRGEANFGKHAWSPFVIKLETRLRFDRLAYKAEMGSMMEAPKSKIPYVRVQQQQDANNAKAGGGELVPDSTLITARFIGDGLLEDLNSHLTPAQRTQDLALRALLEDKLYFLKVSHIQTNPYPFFFSFGPSILHATK